MFIIAFIYDQRRQLRLTCLLSELNFLLSFFQLSPVLSALFGVGGCEVVVVVFLISLRIIARPNVLKCGVAQHFVSTKSANDHVNVFVVVCNFNFLLSVVYFGYFPSPLLFGWLFVRISDFLQYILCSSKVIHLQSGRHI